jgi:hypothetical protein
VATSIYNFVLRGPLPIGEKKRCEKNKKIKDDDLVERWIKEGDIELIQKL